MKRLLIALTIAFSALTVTTTAQADFFGGNNGEWKMGPNGPYWDESDWPEWTPMYWMEEFFDSWDDNNWGGNNWGGNYGNPGYGYGMPYGNFQAPYNYGNPYGGYGYGYPQAPVAPVQ